jgi:hypothetical protein
MHLGKVGHKASTISRHGYEQEITKVPCTDSGHKVCRRAAKPFRSVRWSLSIEEGEALHKAVRPRRLHG